ncbi:hypothetical protein A3H80_01085 [Candidatus Roizmanbacteria bacterium RIFCSPLOWO2_02_FULL_37_19]|uniref:Uncharacterized protein n=1 Tax=Candidatus Roizmanbacteria bacterium RIFCSPHIGHO2_02_FULL_37_24 TaxID=1802037 RepID=A0A1F7GUN0_9BACT|nr:MAG: hypothetical protein A3C24_05205 [Candidatus Roizmanbacteria bacterium RIFCSPHIGHO2_02_FULL_37_24]OGK33931.1 MAG: hypothetical protein A3E10_01990 [Candidatus Roizmanbacteria bacterium RIFCSPHIGHO2_12_FULL_37_23]OGK54194.1 MAG: hypothetical protein A3H80_01085 [Candidatus Roizmanbacteria bacterium RIFCSPLOWO2_02_FULL_37_19]OGK60232.1 MAG: hypothetical protein A3G65_03005 [Candidatus Roizmanbacteria bacterium RIFCSPLOWO2_12_FULL_37_7b]
MPTEIHTDAFDIIAHFPAASPTLLEDASRMRHEITGALPHTNDEVEGAIVLANLLRAVDTFSRSVRELQPPSTRQAYVGEQQQRAVEAVSVLKNLHLQEPRIPDDADYAAETALHVRTLAQGLSGAVNSVYKTELDPSTDNVQMHALGFLMQTTAGHPENLDLLYAVFGEEDDSAPIAHPVPKPARAQRPAPARSGRPSPEVSPITSPVEIQYLNEALIIEYDDGTQDTVTPTLRRRLAYLIGTMAGYERNGFWRSVSGPAVVGRMEEEVTQFALNQNLRKISKIIHGDKTLGYRFRIPEALQQELLTAKGTLHISDSYIMGDDELNDYYSNLPLKKPGRNLRLDFPIIVKELIEMDPRDSFQSWHDAGFNTEPADTKGGPSRLIAGMLQSSCIRRRIDRLLYIMPNTSLPQYEGQILWLLDQLAIGPQELPHIIPQDAAASTELSLGEILKARDILLKKSHRDYLRDPAFTRFLRHLIRFTQLDIDIEEAESVDVKDVFNRIMEAAAREEASIDQLHSS